MRQWQCWLAAGLVTLAFGTGELAAQYRYVQPQTNYYGRPQLSTYLSLNRGAVNYLSSGRQQIQTNQAVGNLQQQVQEQEQLVGRGQTAGATVVGTGHRTYFGAYQQWFPQPGGVLMTPYGGAGIQPSSLPVGTSSSSSSVSAFINVPRR